MQATGDGGTGLGGDAVRANDGVTWITTSRRGDIINDGGGDAFGRAVTSRDEDGEMAKAESRSEGRGGAPRRVSGVRRSDIDGRARRMEESLHADGCRWRCCGRSFVRGEVCGDQERERASRSRCRCQVRVVGSGR